jgi:DNA-binding GntR family transcriptional regulator
MTRSKSSKPRRKGKGGDPAPPKPEAFTAPPPPVLAPSQQPSPVERWYYDAMIRWATARKEWPTVQQLATYTKRSTTPVYRALVRLEAKGYLVRVGTKGSHHRRFVPPDIAHQRSKAAA